MIVIQLNIQIKHHIIWKNLMHVIKLFQLWHQMKINIYIIIYYFIYIVSILQSEQQKRLVVQFDEDENKK